jgi:Flp pilus assembly protein TadD
MGLKRYTAAIELERKALDDGFTNYAPHTVLAAAYALSGTVSEARSELAEAQRLNPALISLRWLRENNQQLMMAAAEGLRLAGLPEDEPAKHLSIVVLPFQKPMRR